MSTIEETGNDDKLIEFMKDMIDSLESSSKWADSREESDSAWYAHEKVSECLEFALKNN